MKTQMGIIEINKNVMSDSTVTKTIHDKSIYVTANHKHWKAKRANFGTKHSFYEAQIGQLDEMIDYVKRITTVNL